jgi:hypothetical protein
MYCYSTHIICLWHIDLMLLTAASLDKNSTCFRKRS